jgi:alkylation response protein AidB-like acyl-CoA dehydrogenase
MSVGHHEQETPGNSAAISSVLAEIATDYRLRLADGGTEPPLQGLKLVRDRRLGAVRLTRDLGGAGYTAPEFFDHVIALAAADPDLAHILRVHYALVEELQVGPKRPVSDRWIAVVAEGGLIGGANAERSRKSLGGNDRDARLVSSGEGLLLRGEKFYSTGAQFSDYLRITAQDDDGNPTAVVIPADRAGVEMSMTGTASISVKQAAVQRYSMTYRSKPMKFLRWALPSA